MLLISEHFMRQCLQCGPDTVSHPIEYFSVMMDTSMQPFGRVFEPVVKSLRKARLPLALPYLLETMASVGLAKVTTSLGPDDSHRTEVIWHDAEKRGIEMKRYKLFGQPTQIFTAKYKNTYIAFDTLPRPLHKPNDGISWMDDKYFLKKLLLKKGLPAAKGDKVFSKTKALKLFRELDKPVICKPRLGSRSRHTTLNLTNEEDFLKAFLSAKQICPWVMVEENLQGDVHRATVIGGKCFGVVKREVAGVFSDGVSTIRKLIEKENQNPKRIVPLHITENTPLQLSEQNYTFDSIPEKDKFIYINKKTSRGQGGRVLNKGKVTHPDNIKLFEDIAAAVNDSLLGIDFIIQDIAKSWKEQPKCGVLEINALPFIDLHHFPNEGEVVNIAGHLWDEVFPDSKNRTTD